MPRRATLTRWRMNGAGVGRVLAYMVVTLWTLLAIFPIAWIYMQSWKLPEETYRIPPELIFQPTTFNYEVILGLTAQTGAASAELGDAVLQSTFPREFLNSVVVTLSTVSLAMVIGFLAAYPLARMRMRGRGLILVAILATRFVPPVVLVLPYYALWRALGLSDTHLGLVLVYLSVTLPFNIWLVRGFLVDLPLELEDAAMVDGCSRLGAMVRVILPVATPGLLTAAIFNMIFVWNELLIAFILTATNARTLPPSIMNYVSDMAVRWGNLYAAAALMLLPVIVFALFVQRHYARGMTGGAVKG